MTTRKDHGEARCSFCGKPRGEVKRLVAGPEVFICDECISICTEILVDDRIVAGAGPGPAAESGPGDFYVGTFSCPRCRATFALHARHPDDPHA